MQDDGWVEDSYYVRPEKQQPADEPAPHTLKAKRNRLNEIATDPSNSISDREDARRLIEIAEIKPLEFARDYSELTARIKKEKP